MNALRFAALAAAVVLAGAADMPSADAAGAPVENSLTVFPNSIDLATQRGEVIERSIGIVQTGVATRVVSLTIDGEAADYVELVDPVTGVVVDQLTAAEGESVFVTLRISPAAPLPDGEIDGTIGIVAEGGEVAVGSVVDLRIDVRGDLSVRADLIAAITSDTIEIGHAFHADLTLDVDGNTALEPDVALELVGPAQISPEAARPAPVEPGGQRVVRASWSTGAWPPGHYDGEITIHASGVEIGRVPVAVDLVPVGQAARSVDVLGIRVLSETEPGGVAKLGVTVRNVGAFEGRAVFVGDLWLEDAPIAPLRSEPLLVRPDATAELVVYASTETAGTYRVRGRANLDGADSSVFAIEFDVADPPTRWPRYLAVVLVVAAALTALRVHRSTGRS